LFLLTLHCGVSPVPLIPPESPPSTTIN